jgi:hypothetical protein
MTNLIDVFAATRGLPRRDEARPTLSIRLHAQSGPIRQASLFGYAAAIGEPEIECDHAGTGRDEQRTITGEWETVCGRCGSIAEHDTE